MFSGRCFNKKTKGIVSLKRCKSIIGELAHQSSTRTVEASMASVGGSIVYLFCSRGRFLSLLITITLPWEAKIRIFSRPYSFVGLPRRQPLSTWYSEKRTKKRLRWNDLPCDGIRLKNRFSTSSRTAVNIYDTVCWHPYLENLVALSWLHIYRSR